MAKLTMTGLTVAERGAVVQRAYCGHAYLLRAEGSRIQSQLGVGASEAVVTPRHARCMLWADGGWRPLAWNRCPVQSCALSASREHGGDSAGRCATGAAEGSVRLCLVGLDGAEAAHLHHTYYGKEDSERCVGYIFSRVIGGVMARSSSAVPF